MLKKIFHSIFFVFFQVKPVSLVSEYLPSHIPQILINRERLPHKSFDIELLGNCDVIIRELCLRLAVDEPSFGRILPQFDSSNIRMKNEILYENLRPSLQKHRRKRRKFSSKRTNSNESNSIVPKERLSSLRPRHLKPSPITSSPPSSSSSSSTARKRPFSSLKSSLFNPNSSFLSYPPRRYLFTGAEIHFSSDEDDDSSDDDLKRKHLQ